MKLFDKIPENFFSLLSRKYKSVYAFSLLTLYDTLKLYKTKIKKSDYLMLLRSRGADLMSLFDIALDRQDDKDDEDEDQTTIATDSSDDSTIAKKTNYICNKLVKTGWMEIERDPKTNIDYIFLPSYSIRFLELISELTSDAFIYLPLVHQTYSELKLEDEKEDEAVIDIEPKEEITYEDFSKMQFQVGEIISCEAVKKSKKLLCSQVKIGSQVKQIVSGIKAHYTPEEMVGKKVMVLVNLKPAKLAGVLSEGMLLCAEDADGNLALMTPEKKMPAGAEIC